jgi:glucosamine--fructose-6-phosphate aminotransferase (isomerizing)
MCGIVGYVGKKSVVPLIVEGLRKLEYRGYDSAGIAVVDSDCTLSLRRAEGKLRNLEEAIRLEPLDGNYGIGHTRWATHGRPTEENAHPHRDQSGRVVVVHNGIIENYLQLKERLAAEGHEFKTETDTEVVAHLIGSYVDEGLNLELAVRKAVQELRGIFALSIISKDEPDTIVAVREGPPVVIGLGDGEFFVASDIPPILEHTRDVFFLGDKEIAVLTKDSVRVTDFEGNAVEPQQQRITWDPIQAEKGGFKHFMLKEIYEQPRAVRDTSQGRVSLDTGKVYLDAMNISEEEFRSFTSIKIAACGTSWHAALAGKYMIEQLARVPVEVDYASEFRYRDPVLSDNDLLIVISQSGETADTIAAMREAKQAGCKVLAICNVFGSMITREADGTILTHAGPEIGVASTKAFTAQMIALYVFACYLGQIRGHIEEETAKKLAQHLAELPLKIEQLLNDADAIEELSKEFFRVQDFLYLGRGINFPVALEGALKLKEISYIHAEGYPAGEMKHGPNALIDEKLPVVVINTKEDGNPGSELRYEKTHSNIVEVKARDGIIVSVLTEGDTMSSKVSDHVIEIPATSDLLGPVLSIVPLQLLSYHIAVRRGCDVDQPRNLAKSVTVE